MNTAFNLLPWRARRRQRRWRHSLLALAMSMLAGSMVWWWLDNAAEAARDAQRQRNHNLAGQLAERNARLAALEQQAQQQRALAITHLQRERERLALIHLLDALARTTPAGVLLTEVQQHGEVLTFTARADNSAQIARAMQQWAAVSAGVPKLSVITRAKTDADVFTLSVPWPGAMDLPVQFAHMEPAR